ncbi:MAG TPA: cell division protein FtsX [Paenibacillaceae bacterium]|nr:cell division protein FtsX [Paenibacillaceae bacterium]
MNKQALGRHIREGTRSLFRNGWMTVASVSAVAITLLIVGVFLTFAFNVNHIVSSIENDVEVKAYLDVTVDRNTAKQHVEAELKKLDGVEQITFITKEEGLKNFKAKFGEKGDLLNSLEKDNFLPDSFVVKAETPQKTEELGQKIKTIKYVKKINTGGDTTKKLFAVTSLVRTVGLVFVIGLGFTAIFLISNTIKITIMARQNEIEIMKLVGATNNFIRWPFFVEGTLIGFVGALIPILIILVGYAYLQRYIQVQLSLYFLDLLPLYPLILQISLILIGIGLFIGVWGSLISVRRFLRI